jgi:DNA-binding NtrC family response regulator
VDNQTTNATTSDPKTILVVDDNPEILAFVARLLCRDGQTILTAVDGEHALAVSKDHQGEIHLLLTDFEMPGISGIELATKMTITRPAIRVLMMSGFVGGMLVLNEGWHFLAKPFIGSQLRSIVTTLLFPDSSRFRS